MPTQEQLLQDIKDLLKKGGGTSGGSSSFDNMFRGIGGPLGESLQKVTEKFNPLTTGASLVGDAFTAVKDNFKSLEGVLMPNLTTWRRLSTTGASFDGSIVEMATSAKRARLTLDELADFGAKNAGYLNNLTGEIGNGIKAFTILSDKFANTGNFASNLKQLGYDTAEYNEVLALTTGNFNNFAAKTKDRDLIAFQATEKLAFEFDSLSKLTGKNRKELEDQYRKQQLDGQAEAKLRLITAGMEENQAREVRANYQKLRLEAELQGQEALFKEQFAFGSVKSKEATAQLVMTGEAGQSLAEAADQLAKGQVKEANSSMEQSRIAMNRLMDDKNFLGIAILNQDNQYAKFNADLITKNMNYRKASMAVEEEMDKAGLLAGKNKAEIEQAVFKEVIKRATELPTKPTAESTKTLLNIESSAQAVGKAFMDDIVKPLNEDIAPALKKFNESLNLISGKVLQNGEIVSTGTAISREIEAERKRKPDTTGSSATKEGNAVANNPTAPSTFIGQDALRGIGAAVRALEEAIEKVAPKETRTLGSPKINDFLSGGSFKNMFEEFGAGTNMQLDGREIVANEQQVSALMAKAQSSVTSMLGGGGGQNQDEFVAVLKQISTNIKQMVTYTASVADHAQRQVRATKNLSNNMYEA